MIMMFMADDRDAFAVEGVVEEGGAGRLVGGAGPCGDEGLVGIAAAKPAGTVAGGEGYGLVEEEEFGVAVWGHELTLPALEAEGADEPGPCAPAVCDELSVLVVQAAAIAHEESALGHGLDGGEWCDAVAQWHNKCSPLILKLYNYPELKKD